MEEKVSLPIKTKIAAWWMIGLAIYFIISPAILWGGKIVGLPGPPDRFEIIIFILFVFGFVLGSFFQGCKIRIDKRVGKK